MPVQILRLKCPFSLVFNAKFRATPIVSAHKIPGKARLSGVLLRFGERCRELVDAADETTRRLYNVIDWMFEHPGYNPKTKIIPKKDCSVLVDVMS